MTSIDQKSSVVSAKENATGRAFQFKVGDGKLLGSLRVGQAVYANFKTNQVSLDGKAACCSILTGPTGSPERTTEPGNKQAAVKPTVASKGGQQPVPTAIRPTEDSTESAIRGLTAATTPTAAAASAACCSITGLDTGSGNVSARATATGQVFAFAVSDRRLFDSLKVGQPVYANFKAGQVSLDGKTTCCSILKVEGSLPVQDRVPQAKSQSEPGSGGGGRVALTPTPPAPAHVDIVGQEQPLEFAQKNRPSIVWARFTNAGATLPADSAAADPLPGWLVDGQSRTSDTTEPARPKGQVPTSGRRAWPQSSERTYEAGFTLTPGLHEIRAVMPAQPTEVSTGNNTTVFPVMAGSPDLVAEFDEAFINNGSLNSSYTRYRFWAENKGDIPSPPSRIRLTFSYRPVVQPPIDQEGVAWTPYESVVRRHPLDHPGAQVRVHLRADLVSDGRDDGKRDAERAVQVRVRRR